MVPEFTVEAAGLQQHWIIRIDILQLYKYRKRNTGWY